MARCLVLGANGFIGSHVVTALLAEGHQVRVYERRIASALPAAVEKYQGLLDDAGPLKEVMRGVDCVIYLSWTGYPATIKSNFALDVHANLLTAIQVMESCRLMAVPRLIFASSGGTVYGLPLTEFIAETHPAHPISAHGLGKLMAEQYLAIYRHRREISSIILRPANAYGPEQWPERRQGFIATALGRIAQHKTVEVWGDGTTIRDYVYVDDVAQAFVKAVGYSGSENVFNIGSGAGRSLHEVLKEIERATGRPLNVKFLPARTEDVPRNVLDITRARQQLHWEPSTPLAEGLERTWQWIQQQL